MKKPLLSIVSLAALSGSAVAADLPSRKESVIAAPATMSWSGLYAGINAGYGGNSIDTSSSSIGNGFVRNFTGSRGVGGPLAGGQVGYNHQFANNLVLGIETDLNYTDVRNFNSSPSGVSSAFANGPFVGIDRSYSRIGMNWQGTTRARLGYAMGNFLPFVSAGVAYGELTNSTSSVGALVNGFGPSGAFSGGAAYGSASVVQGGWAAGAGAEYMVANSWSIKGEYLYTSLAGITTNVVSSTFVSDKITTGSFGIHQLRAGINYHTDWLGAGPAVVAKY